MAKSGKRLRRLSDGYSFAGFCARAAVRGVFGDPDERIVRLERRSKKRLVAVAGSCVTAGMIGAYGRFATCRAQDVGFFWNSKCGASHAAVVAQ
jgi:hypothetical protein